MQYRTESSSWSCNYTTIPRKTCDAESDDDAGGGGHHQVPELIEKLASENAVVIFSVSSCCMCHAIKQLFCSMGVNPTVYELDDLDDPRARQDMEEALMGLLGTSSSAVVPVVFIGGQLVGPMDRVMASHINGSLVPLLKGAGALWL